MAITLENVNIARKSQGLEPLDKLATDTATPEQNKTPESKKEPEAEVKIPAEDKKPEIPVSEATEESVLAYLAKNGFSVKSLEELKPKDPSKTPEQIAEEKEQAKLTYGLAKGFFKKAEYESFIVDKSAPSQLAFTHFAEEAKKEDPSLTDEEISEEFTEKFGLNAEPGTRKHKRGAKELALIGNEILKAKYGKIYEADGKFASYESEVSAQAALKNDIQAKTPAYLKNIEDVFTASKKMSVDIGDDETVEIDLPEAGIQSVKDIFTRPDFIENQIRNNFSKEQIAEQVSALLTKQNFKYVTEKAVKAAIDKKAAGVRGIVTLEGSKKVPTTTKELTENQKIAYQALTGSPYQPNN